MVGAYCQPMTAQDRARPSRLVRAGYGRPSLLRGRPSLLRPVGIESAWLQLSGISSAPPCGASTALPRRMRKGSSAAAMASSMELVDSVCDVTASYCGKTAGSGRWSGFKLEIAPALDQGAL